MQIDKIQKARLRRKLRVHKKVLGTQERPRLSMICIKAEAEREAARV